MKWPLRRTSPRAPIDPDMLPWPMETPSSLGSKMYVTPVSWPQRSNTDWISGCHTAWLP